MDRKEHISENKILVWSYRVVCAGSELRAMDERKDSFMSGIAWQQPTTSTLLQTSPAISQWGELTEDQKHYIIYSAPENLRDDQEMKDFVGRFIQKFKIGIDLPTMRILCHKGRMKFTKLWGCIKRHDNQRSKRQQSTFIRPSVGRSV